MAKSSTLTFKTGSGDTLELSTEQTVAYRDVVSGRNVLITGQAGTGKSTLLKLLRAKYGEALAVTASTGIAALGVGGTTIHSFAGLGLAKGRAAAIATHITSEKGRAYNNIIRCKILALDEVSMVSADLFEKIDQVFRMVRRTDVSFGGVQLLALGDFLQLPPVARMGEPPAQFAFECDAWVEAAISVHVLTRVYRQADQPFADALGHLRVGNIQHPSIAMIAGRKGAVPPDDGIRPTIVHTHNVDVDRINQVELDQLPGQEHLYCAQDTGQSEAKEKLDRDCLAPRELKLKVGAQVMLLANVDLDAGLVNGRLGLVTKLGAGAITVCFGADQVVNMEWHKWNIMRSNHEVAATREQFPLKLAYAITIHKAQGITLDRIVCHLGRTFDYGQAYVAVSRVRTLEGLFLVGGSRHCFKAHPKALAFYEEAQRFQLVG